MFTNERMNEIETKEALYLIKFIRDIVGKCLDGQENMMIPIFNVSLWASSGGKMEVIIDPSPNIEIQQGWKLSALALRIKEAIDAWDTEDIGQKLGKVIDMHDKLGWTVKKP